MVRVQYVLSQKEDMTLSFEQPTSRRAIYELRELEGVNYAETYRTVPVKLKFGQRSYKTVINGIEPDSHLHILLDKNLKNIAIPPSGILLTDHLGEYSGS